MGPRPDILQTESLINCSRGRTRRVGVEPTMLSGAPGGGVSQKSCQGNLQVGNGRVAESRGPRAGRDTRLICVRVVGDCAFGWAEAANTSGVTVEVIVHLIVNNHMVSIFFALPKSCRCATAIRLFWLSGFGGMNFTTVLDSEQTAMSGKLFNLWQPLVAILALPSNLSRIHTGKLLAYFDWQRYKPYRHTLHHEAMGGVTRSCWFFVHVTRRVDLSPDKKIMTDDCYARTLQTALDDTVGKAVQMQTIKVFSKGESRTHHNAWGRVQVPQLDGWSLVFDSDGLVPDLVDLRLSWGEWFWVRARCVYSPGKNILRQIKYVELLGLWDYEGKLESTKWTEDIQKDVLKCLYALTEDRKSVSA